MLLVHKKLLRAKGDRMKKDIVSVENKVLAVTSFFKGKTELQICTDMKIKPAVFKRWYVQYAEIGYKHNWLMEENERLKKMFVNLSLINQVLNDAIAETKENGSQ